MSTESAVKHTPGPWDVTEIGTIEDRSHNPRQICSINPWNREANARLIAAAPAMLEALEFTLNLLENLTSTDFSMGGDKPARDKMKTVIRKAKGE